MKLNIRANNTTRSATAVEAFEAHHPSLGTGTLFQYPSQDGKAFVARFFPKEWWQGCLYIPATAGVDPNIDPIALANKMGLDHILGAREVTRNFRITTATKLWLVDADYEGDTLTFVLKRLSESHKFEIPGLGWDENDENLEEKVMAHLNSWVWNTFPGCSLNVGA